ncbi:hypothetical protein GCM10022410_25880 [Amphibacillus indicireducens]|uniref:Uncharacterized protein n=1 Tax=Amphibacillus indicireducens TaxID=1076330 RepID=A0ABP7W4R1_9BACI
MKQLYFENQFHFYLIDAKTRTIKLEHAPVIITLGECFSKRISHLNHQLKVNAFRKWLINQTLSPQLKVYKLSTKLSKQLKAE